MHVRDLLEIKGDEVVSIHPHASLADAAGLLTRHRIGALVVIDQGNALCGTVSERDVTHQLATHGAELLAMRVDQIMTRRTTITCTLKDDVTGLMARMTKGRFRHLPVVQDGSLRGIISIGDLEKSRLEQLESKKDQRTKPLAVMV